MQYHYQELYYNQCCIFSQLLLSEMANICILLNCCIYRKKLGIVMKVLLTGAAGKVGSDVCQQLHEAGVEVIAADRRLRPSLPVRLRLANFLDRLHCYELVQEADAVVHFAAYPHDIRGLPPEVLVNENISMVENLLQAAYESKIKKFIYASSVQAMAYRRWIDENDNIAPSRLEYLPADGRMTARPSSPYGMSKKISEELVEFYTREYGMNGVSIRFPAVINNDHIDHYRSHHRNVKHRHHSRYLNYWASSAEECFSCLSSRDAGRLVNAVLSADIKEYKCYFPTASTLNTEIPIPELIKKYFPNVKLRKPVEEMTHLVDISAIVKDTGWQPMDDVAAMLRGDN